MLGKMVSERSCSPGGTPALKYTSDREGQTVRSDDQRSSERSVILRKCDDLTGLGCIHGNKSHVERRLANRYFKLCKTALFVGAYILIFLRLISQQRKYVDIALLRGSAVPISSVCDCKSTSEVEAHIGSPTTHHAAHYVTESCRSRPVSGLIRC